MTEPKTKATDASVTAFLNKISDPKKRQDCFTVLEIMRDVTHEEPKLWGPSIVGFGSYHYKYESGREGDSPIAGFSPRKQNLTLYLNLGSGFEEYGHLLKKLGKHSLGKGCLYIKKLDDVQLPVLKELVNKSVTKKLKSMS
jgi:hypothetical protein